MDYATLKLIHQSAVVLSLTGFLARGLGMLGDAAWIRTRAARTLPHVVDTVLLASALGLVWMLRVSPFVVPWLAAKLVGLIVYIVLGSIALKRGQTKRVRALAWVAALLTFGYIVSVAITKDPRGLLVFGG
ncbi:MAG TPA: SirB2 family protein [Casimicrobiaceae bacterium]